MPADPMCQYQAARSERTELIICQYRTARSGKTEFICQYRTAHSERTEPVSVPDRCSTAP
eukprot:3311741-Rhodomonas_salina.3